MEAGEEGEKRHQRGTGQAEEEEELVRVLVPGCMRVSVQGCLRLKESLELGNVLLLEEGGLESVRILKSKMTKIREEVFSGNEVGQVGRKGGTEYEGIMDFPARDNLKLERYQSC